MPSYLYNNDAHGLELCAGSIFRPSKRRVIRCPSRLALVRWALRCLCASSGSSNTILVNRLSGDQFHQSLPSSPPLSFPLSPPFLSAVLAPPASRPTLPLPAACFARVTTYLCRRPSNLLLSSFLLNFIFLFF